ncbi:putative RNA recognition motif domain, nucleotide-binding alpha-beta plait domain superfamily [Helianthus annuus]|uniref:Putative nucleotide-binding alpha-beta plait domain-containing protein n=1 Tax=Helianthus annuus TaxID=4232 RepID=A0A251U505_HELAN|nr:uncharacterized protein LOC110872581 isoform X2 [Helianthus annuus]KAF5817510.1 putative RNA recognition motif domain, nucleotide-binding alpha-beta plait domain superfamily [Helianthus annuus]KAJ0776439.1 putative RNA recognition motif domain, nucleotide-binding alpha-beta plait domain superfamily [Helianthus annuus]KAJ0950842.1 putative RNA recognition motif domain, nucleotide-binding alpha-beta plait domain superfamily [Helianthus annuus]
MASTEQPPKKRRPPYDPSQQPPTPPPPVSTPSPVVQSDANAPSTTFTPEQIVQKRRNQEEIKNFYESFKQLKDCVSQKDAVVMPELEQAFLALISFSRACTSVQRLVAEFVPKYASYCPTALEAAAKVCINIHNWSIAVVGKGIDADVFLYGTAKICIFGLANICVVASSEMPTSSVIQGICSAVFRDVLNFLISSLEGQDIFQIVNKDDFDVHEFPKTYAELKKKFFRDDDDEEESPVKLSKYRAVCILWIFFMCPRNSLAACFELCGSDSTDAGPNGGQYFLNQVTARLDGQVLIDDNLPEDSSNGFKRCLLSLILDDDPSMKQWIFSTAKSIIKTASPNVVSAVTSAFEKVFESFTEQVNAHDKQVDSNVDDQLSALHLEHHGSIASETDLRENTGSNNSVDHRELSRASSSTPSTVHASSSTPQENDAPVLNVSTGGQSSNFESPKHHFLSWHCDGDRAAMDIYPASSHLWLGSVGPEASEPQIRYQFERFGPINKLLYVPFKGFAVIEYRNIMDAIKAREVMRGRSLFGACLIIKFLDIGLGTRGDTNGVAVGSCCHVYVGNIYSQSDKDEILYELRKNVFKGPLGVTDLVNEGALLMEFGTPEEAAMVMAFLRQYRKEKRDFYSSSVDRSSHGSCPPHVDMRNSNLGNGVASSPHAQSVVGFSHYGPHNANTMELTSPRMNMVNQGASMQSGYPFQPGAPEQSWTHSTPMHAHNYAPSQPMPPSSYHRPVYYPPNSSWDPHGMSYNNAVAPPFIPASVTPLAQIQTNSLPHHDHMFYVPPGPPGPPPLAAIPTPQPPPNMPPPLPPHQNMPPGPPMPPPLPIHPEYPPPLPPCPPPFLETQPPPPPPPTESSTVGSGGYWQGMLSKSGVHYSAIHARRLHSDVCNYGDNFSEPAEWPTKLDITKRTDYKHVMSTFSSTPPHKREVCQLLPDSSGDQKGFQDFISYLKQRECAGVIKIPATKTVWARLLFILPYSQETCSHLSVTPETSDCLIALVLPKETNFEWV